MSVTTSPTVDAARITSDNDSSSAAHPAALANTLDAPVFCASHLVAPVAAATGKQPWKYLDPDLDPAELTGPLFMDDQFHEGPSGETTLFQLRGDWKDGAGSFLPLDVDESDPLTRLAAEYRQALLHRKRSYQHELKTATVDGGPSIAPPQDPFAGPPGQDTDGSLLDLLVGGKNIDNVLEHLDTFGAERIFAGEEQHEILSLLAPDNTPLRHLPRTAQLAREEHHLISVDSHIHMLDSTEHEEPGFEHENHR